MTIFYALIAFLILILILLVVYYLETLYNVKKVKKILHNTKMYCLECSKTFYMSDSFKTNIDVYPCPECAGGNTCLYEDKDELIELYSKGKRKLACIDCNKKFLEEHTIKTEAGIYPCPFCAGKQTYFDEPEDSELSAKNTDSCQ